MEEMNKEKVLSEDTAWKKTTPMYVYTLHRHR